jgi:hypothetical protein
VSVRHLFGVVVIARSPGIDVKHGHPLRIKGAALVSLAPTAMITTANDPRYSIPPPTPPCTQGIGSRTFKPPTLDGSNPFPELYDWQYHHSPDHPVFVFDDPSTSGPDDIRDYRWKTVVPVIHRTGRRILSLLNLTLPLNPERLPVIAVLAAAGTYTIVWPKTWS